MVLVLLIGFFLFNLGLKWIAGSGIIKKAAKFLYKNKW